MNPREPDDEVLDDLEDDAGDAEAVAGSGRKRSYLVSEIDRAVRLDKYLIERQAGLSRMRIKNLINEGNILVNHRPAKPSQSVKPLDEIEVRLPPSRPLDLEPEAIPLSILYEDEHLVAVDKAAGMVVHPGVGHTSGTLVNALLAHCDHLSGIGGVARPGIVHRLDRGTSGVIVVAKSDDAHQALSEMFKHHQLEKTYVAVTVGVPRDRKGTVQSYISRHPIYRKKMASVTSGGKWAVTHYRILADYGHFALVELDLETGRTHQIRVHMADCRTPVLGDTVYGRKPRASRLTDAELARLVGALDRPLLHARRLAMSHPVSGEPLVLNAPIPSEMEAVIDRLASLRREDR